MVSLFSFLAYTALVALIAWALTRRETLSTSDGYFLAGRSLNGWVIAGSLILTNLSSEHLIGLNADAYRHTIAVMAWETTSALAMVLMALYFLPRYLRRGLTTIPEFLAQRYDADTRLIASTLFLLSYSFAILPIVLVFGAAGLESLFHVSETWNLDRDVARWLLIWGVGTLGALYAILGGLRAVAISDTVNGIGFLIAGLLVPVLALRLIGDGDIWRGMSAVYEAHPEKFDITGEEPESFLPMSVLFTGMIVNQVFFWCTNQSIAQRTLAARSLAEGQKGVLIAAVFKLLAPLVIVLPGVLAFHLFYDELGDEGAMLAYPRLAALVLPPVLTGLFAAVVVGAILSTFNSVLNSSATLFSQGIYHRLRPNATDRQLVRAGRVCSMLLALAAMTSAPMIDTEGSLYELLQRINATFFGPMLAVILLGMLTRWATPLAAKVALIGGPVMFYVLVFGWDEQVQQWLRRAMGSSEDIHFLHFLAAVFLLTILGMRLISALAPRDYVEHLPAQQFVDMTPWRWAVPASVAVSAITIGCYFLLAK